MMGVGSLIAAALPLSDVLPACLARPCSMTSEDNEKFFTEWEETFDSFDQMGLHENLLRGIYAYGEAQPGRQQPCRGAHQHSKARSACPGGEAAAAVTPAQRHSPPPLLLLLCCGGGWRMLLFWRH